MSRANPLDAALDDFEPRPREDKPRPDRQAIEQVAKENGFVSRDARKLETAATTAPPRRQRRFTTGRNQQINIKATPDYDCSLQCSGRSTEYPVRCVARARRGSDGRKI